MAELPPSYTWQGICKGCEVRERYLAHLEKRVKELEAEKANNNVFLADFMAHVEKKQLRKEAEVTEGS